MEMLGVSASGKTIHDWVQKKGKESNIARHKSTKALALDGTKVCAGGKKNGSDLNLGIGVEERDNLYGRPYNQKKLLAFSVGKSWNNTIGQCQAIKTNLIISDGENTFDNLSHNLFPNIPRQRCIWHLKRNFGWCLKEFSGLSKEQREIWSRKLNDVIYDKKSTKEAKRKYSLLIRDLKEKSYKTAAQYLENAKEYVFTFREKNQKKGSRHLGTSILERLMREVNRRTDVGVRWTDQGVYNLIKLRLIKYLEPAYWEDKIWSNIPKSYNYQPMFNISKVNIRYC